MKNKILVDADACPVKEIVTREAKKRNIEVIMICDTSHIISDQYSRTITVDKAADSADLVLINITNPGDIVVTQDFGVAAVALSKGGVAINQNGMIYDNNNIDRLLFERFLSAKVRRAGKRTKGHKKRTTEDDEAFLTQFIKMIDVIV